MVQEFLQKFCEEFSIPRATLKKNKKGFFLQFSPEVDLVIFDLQPGVAMRASICKCSELKREELFVHLMNANLLGQGTGKARIGLDVDEKSLTLSLGLPYEIDYKSFKDAFEEFVNLLLFWREESKKFEMSVEEGFYK